VNGEIRPCGGCLAVRANSSHFLLEDYYVFQPLIGCSVGKTDSTGILQVSFSLFVLMISQIRLARCYRKVFRSACF
jgi:hypothetical protein